MMCFVLGLEAAQDRDRIFDAGFANVHRLESALERRIFFDMFAVFVEGGCTDATQLAAGQFRFEQIGRVA